jgi:hypothetical protein
MTSLEGLEPDAAVHGILPNALVTGVSVQWLGNALANSHLLHLLLFSPPGRGCFPWLLLDQRSSVGSWTRL